MRALALCVVVLVAVSLAAAVEPARACSCIAPDTWSYLRKADGAFVGRLVSRREADQGRAVLTFDVERAVKGKIGTTVEVTTANNGAACGIETSVSSKRMLFLSADRREMTRLLDLRLRTVAQFRWTGGQGILVRSNVVGIRQKSLLVAALPSGPTRVARRLPGQPDVIVAAAR